MMHFKRANRNFPPLPKDSAARQGAIARLAFSLLGGREGALEFLNSANEELDGRPLDLATASDNGFVRVEKEIKRRAARLCQST
jgi:hypothetical protein